MTLEEAMTAAIRAPSNEPNPRIRRPSWPADRWVTAHLEMGGDRTLQGHGIPGDAWGVDLMPEDKTASDWVVEKAET